MKPKQQKISDKELVMMQVAAAVRTLSNLGVLEFEIGGVVTKPTSQRYGPLTVATNRKTGELGYLWCDSSVGLKPEDLTFRMTLAAPANEDETPVVGVLNGMSLLSGR